MYDKTHHKKKTFLFFETKTFLFFETINFIFMSTSDQYRFYWTVIFALLKDKIYVVRIKYLYFVLKVCYFIYIFIFPHIY